MGDWVESTSASRGAEDTWGPYWDALFPPRRVLRLDQLEANVFRSEHRPEAVGPA